MIKPYNTATVEGLIQENRLIHINNSYLRCSTIYCKLYTAILHTYIHV